MLSPALVALAVLVVLTATETVTEAKSRTPSGPTTTSTTTTSTTTTATPGGGGGLWLSISPGGGFSIGSGPSVSNLSGFAGPLGPTTTLRHVATRSNGDMQVRLYEGSYSPFPGPLASSCQPTSQVVAEVSTTAIAGNVTFYGQSTPGITQSSYLGVTEGDSVAVVVAQVPTGTKAGVVHFAGGPTVRATPVSGGWVVVAARTKPPAVVRRPVPLLTDTSAATVGTFSTVDHAGHSHPVGSVRLGTGFPVSSSCLPNEGGASVQPIIAPPTPVALPAATGPPPADPTAARQQIEAAYRTVFTAKGSTGAAPDLEGGPVLSAAARKQLQAGYGDILGKLTVRVDDFRFLNPAQAALSFDLLLNGAPVTAPTVGHAVLVNGKWKVARATFCTIVGRANIPCA